MIDVHRFNQLENGETSYQTINYRRWKFQTSGEN